MDDWCYDIHAAVAATEPQPATRDGDGDSALARVLALLRELEDLGVVQVVGVVKENKKRKETYVERTNQA